MILFVSINTTKQIFRIILQYLSLIIFKFHYKLINRLCELDAKRIKHWSLK